MLMDKNVYPTIYKVCQPKLCSKFRFPLATSYQKSPIVSATPIPPIIESVIYCTRVVTAKCFFLPGPINAFKFDNIQHFLPTNLKSREINFTSLL
ncbi:hypothetical protein QQP08_001722 [Theobroma cacao]|nr:hypothetical protein QQP08_001722 [Theobroma cacao]